jgi:hypothetical protein
MSTGYMNHRGMSLAWVRKILGKPGPLHKSCHDFIEHHAGELHATPEIGEVVLFKNNANGDIGLCVGYAGGRAFILRLDMNGLPRISAFDPKMVGYVGAMPWPDETE